MKHPDKIKSRLKKLRQSLPELQHYLDDAVKRADPYSIVADKTRELAVVQAKIAELEWVMGKGN